MKHTIALVLALLLTLCATAQDHGRTRSQALANVERLAAQATGVQASRTHAQRVEIVALLDADLAAGLLTAEQHRLGIEATADVNTPWAPSPASTWGVLREPRIGVDSTWVTHEPGTANLPVHCAAVRGLIACSTKMGIMTYDPDRGTTSYVWAGLVRGEPGEVPYWKHSDLDSFMMWISCSERGVCITSARDFGFVIWSVIGTPKVLYQDGGGRGWMGGQVYATEDWAFGIDANGGISAYDLRVAQGCSKSLENNRDGGVTKSCPGAWVDFVPRSLPQTIHGAGELVALRHSGGLDVYRLDGLTGRLSLRINSAALPATSGGVAMWKAGSVSYLAIVGSEWDGAKFLSFVWVYDVSCASSSTCALGAPLNKWDVTDWSSTYQKMSLLTLSVDNGRPWLYVGSSNKGGAVVEREFLLDLGDYNPGAPMPAIDAGPGYFEWYMDLRDFRPRSGVVLGDKLYRACESFFDIHRIVDSTDPGPDPPDPPTDPDPPDPDPDPPGPEPPPATGCTTDPQALLVGQPLRLDAASFTVTSKWIVREITEKEYSTPFGVLFAPLGGLPRDVVWPSFSRHSPDQIRLSAFSTGSMDGQRVSIGDLQEGEEIGIGVEVRAGGWIETTVSDASGQKIKGVGVDWVVRGVRSVPMLAHGTPMAQLYGWPGLELVEICISRP